MTLPPDPARAFQDQAPDLDSVHDDVIRGLRETPKRLPSHYLYDERGARLFERICETEEYYPTRTEIRILQRNMVSIAEQIGPRAMVIEPGSGSGIKTRMLLENLEMPAAYVPIDVSKEQLAQYALRMHRDFPELEVLPVCADFTRTVTIPECGAEVLKRVMYFPGSTIGNLRPPDAVVLLRQMSVICGAEGGILVGVDLKKDREILVAAYDDSEGYSRDFALNILVRLNRELGADFDLDQFDYQAPYNEQEGRIEMAVVSQCRQVVHIGRHRVEIEEGEPVGTEFSYKYAESEFAELAARGGLRVVRSWTDPDRYFSVQYLMAH